MTKTIVPKNYATTLVKTKSCYFKRDYSYISNPTGRDCLRCVFCYKRSASLSRKCHSAHLLKSEMQHSEQTLKTPIIISRLCDPFATRFTERQTKTAIEIILENNAQFILKTSQCIPGYIGEMMTGHEDDILIQYRMVTSGKENDKAILRFLAYRFPPVEKLKENMKLFSQFNRAVIFDPYIIGINDTSLYNLIPELAEVGINKIIVKQAFLTPKFAPWISQKIDRKFGNLLNVEVNGFMTYDNVVMLEYLYPALKLAKENNVSISFCNNRYLNELLYPGYNCCQFDKPKGIYNIDRIREVVTLRN